MGLVDWIILAAGIVIGLVLFPLIPPPYDSWGRCFVCRTLWDEKWN